MHRRALLAVGLLGALGTMTERRLLSAAPRGRFTGSRGAAEPPGPGVPLALARERAARVADVKYELHFTIPDSRSAPVRGTAVIRFRLDDASRPLALDFAGPPDSIEALQSSGKPVAAVVAAEHILIAPGDLREGENRISLAFAAGDSPLNRQDDFLYTLFVPARARFAFPCFDQPDIKARYSLSLDVPDGWEAISNGAAVSQERTASGVRLSFAGTAPLSTYLFAFAAGRFSVERGERRGRAFRMLHRETDADKVSRNRDAIFDLHASALDWLEQYTGIPYPFDKFEFLLVPSFQFGGMEHPGSIYYNADALLLDPSATQNQMLGRASLIAHETAHMWFGDLVTMRWFDDVWMKEVFANFMAARIVNPSFPGINHDLRFLFAHYPAAYDVDRTPGTNPIRQRLDNLNDAGSLYGAIIYQKAPVVMRQLEMIVGADGLRDGLREYLRLYSYGNAGWPDLIRLLDRTTPEDLAAWSRAWVDESGRPTIAVAAVQPREEAVEVTLGQQDGVPGRGVSWTQRLKVTAGFPAALAHAELTMTGSTARAEVPSPSGGPPLFVLPTGGGIGYGDVVLDERSRDYLCRGLHLVDDALTRGAAAVTLWEEMLGGRVAAADLFDTLLHAVGREPDELNVQRLLGYAQQAFWKFFDPDTRSVRAAQFESVLEAGLAGANTSSLKSAWFNALRDMALTGARLAWLERVWRGTEQVPGLTLAEPDYMTLALELAVRGVDGWQAILQDQRRRIRNPDRVEQFAFVMPALDADAARRDAFVESLRDVRNRRREAWVLQAVSYVHHPLRAPSAERHLETALGLLQEIQQTGDIFFPRRWMDATLGGHRSAGAAARVRGFLQRLPARYPDRLRRIILSSADTLFRASREGVP